MTPHTTPSGPNFVNKTSSSLLLHHAIWFQDFTVLNKIYHQPGMCPRQDQSPATILRNILSLIHNKVINTSNKSKIHLIYQFLLNKIISKSTCALCRELVTLSTLLSNQLSPRLFLNEFKKRTCWRSASVYTFCYGLLWNLPQLNGLPWSILMYKKIQLITLSGSSSP